jgi:hypothetical protein
MTVVEFLRENGPCEAVYIARQLDMLLGDVYGELVQAEADGDAVVVVPRVVSRSCRTQWKAAPGVLVGA